MRGRKKCNWVDMIALAVAGLSCFFAIKNYLKYKELQGAYNAMVEIQTLTAQGSLETQIRSSIAEAANNMAMIGVEVAKDVSNQILQSAYGAAEEVYRNAYEDACGKYIDGKIDKERFRKFYQIEIRSLVEEEPNRQYYADNQSPYSSTLSVYKEWYHQA